MIDRIYAIGDIHGQYDKLLDALTLIEVDGGAEAPVVVLGDLVDRGPDSRGVIETLLNGKAEGRDWTVLMGNHDRLFIDFMKEGRPAHPKLRAGLAWLDERIGGRETLASYGVDRALGEEDIRAAALQAVPQAHVDFLESCPLSHETEELFFVHAGIQPRLPLEWQTEDDMLWIRDPFLEHDGPFPKLVVHGHSAVQAPEHRGNRVNLDRGAGWGRPLTAAVFEEGRVFVLRESGREELTPVA